MPAPSVEPYLGILRSRYPEGEGIWWAYLSGEVTVSHYRAVSSTIIFDMDSWPPKWVNGILDHMEMRDDVSGCDVARHKRKVNHKI